MVVVASSYAGPELRPEQVWPRHERVGLEILVGTPVEQPAATRRRDSSLPSGYPIGLAYQKKLLVKMSLIIVNAGPGQGSSAARQGRQPHFHRRRSGFVRLHRWATPWANNPIKPDWLVCRLTQSGDRVLG
jgi:hypothetical protein